MYVYIGHTRVYKYISKLWIFFNITFFAREKQITNVEGFVKIRDFSFDVTT